MNSQCFLTQIQILSCMRTAIGSTFRKEESFLVVHISFTISDLCGILQPQRRFSWAAVPPASFKDVWTVALVLICTQLSVFTPLP